MSLKDLYIVKFNKFGASYYDLGVVRTVEKRPRLLILKLLKPIKMHRWFKNCALVNISQCCCTRISFGNIVYCFKEM